MSATKNNPVGSKAKPERVKKVRKFTSVVWEMFSFIRDGDGKVIDKTRVQCKRCGIVIAYSSSTSNMRSHMSSCSYEGCVKLFGSSSGEGCGSAGMTRHGSGPSHTQAPFSFPPGPSGPSGDVAKEMVNRWDNKLFKEILSLQKKTQTVPVKSLGKVGTRKYYHYWLSFSILHFILYVW